MACRQNTESLILSAFPGHGTLIERALSENKVFRELCRDYRDCAVALDRWRRLNGPWSSSRVREYAELLSQLGSEIVSWLTAMESGPALSRRTGPR